MLVESICQCCKGPMVARSADLKRGWGKFCSKSCKAIKQESRTGQFASFKHRRENYEEYSYESDPGDSMYWDNSDNGVCEK